MSDKKFNDEGDAIDAGKVEVSKESPSHGDYGDAAQVDFECGKQEIGDRGQKQAQGFNDDAALGIDDGNKVG